MASGTIPRWGSSAGDPATYSNTVRIGYARVSGRTQEHQLQLDALAGADCREVVIETASTRTDRPKLRQALAVLKPGDTLVIYKPDRVARSMKELLVLLEDQLHAREINLHILTASAPGCTAPPAPPSPTRCCSWSPPWPRRWNATSSANAPSTAWPPPRPKAAGGGHPSALDADTLAVAVAVAVARHARGESVTAIARHLGLGRSTLYRHSANLSPPETDPPTRLTAGSCSAEAQTPNSAGRRPSTPTSR